MTPTQECAKYLNDIMVFVNGTFDYQASMDSLRYWLQTDVITQVEYLNLVDACNHRNTDGHYENSLIYKRALETEKELARKNPFWGGLFTKPQWVKDVEERVRRGNN